MRQTNRTPYARIDGNEPSTTFQTMRPTRTHAAAAAAPATTWRDASPARNRLPVRRVASTAVNYEWIFEMVFSATTSTWRGMGWKSSFGPNDWPRVTAQKRNFRSSAAFADCVGTIT